MQLRSLRNIWKSNSFLGIDPEEPYHKRRSQMMSNHINMAVIVLSFLLLIIDTADKVSRGALIYTDGANHEYGIGYRFLLAIIIAVINLWLATTSWVRISRWLLIFGVSYAYLILPLQIGPIYDELYLWYPYAGVPFMVVPVMILDLKKEKWLLILSFLYCVSFSLFSEELLNFYAVTEMAMQDIIKVHWLFYRVAPTTITVFIFITVMYLVELNDSNAIKVENRNLKLKKTLKELKETQGQLIKHEKMAVVGRMSSEFTHELNTPITAIKANLGMIAFDQQTRLLLLRKVSVELTKNENALLDELLNSIYDKVQQNDNPIFQLNNDYLDLEKELLKHDLDPPLARNWAMLLADHRYLDLQKYLPLIRSRVSIELVDFLTSEYQQLHSFLISQKAITQAERLIYKLKTYSYMNKSTDNQPFNLTEVLYNSIDLLKNQMSTVNCHLDIEPELPSVMGNADEIMQVINNLVTNALQAMGHKGDIYISLTRDERFLRLVIEDSGGGIQSDINEDIFEAFFTTKPKGEGSGLGLNISKQIIENHMGSINWFNTDKGASFTIKLPY